MAVTVYSAPGPDQPQDVKLIPQVLAHYELVGPLMEKSFAGDPIVFAHFPNGFGRGMAQYGITDVPLSESKLLWLVHRQYAIEFHGWAPRNHDAETTRLRFGRILLETRTGPSFERVQFGAQRMSEHLKEDGIDAIALHDGQLCGMALWIPLADAPEAKPLRVWLHAVCDRAVAADPDLFTTEPNTHDNGRIHLHVQSNARHHYSALPYSLRGATELPVVAPVEWNEVGALAQNAFTAATFPERLAEKGDVFAAEVKRIGQQSMPQKTFAAAVDLSVEPHGHIISAAVTILREGGLRTAQEILAEALKRKLVPPNTTGKYVYSALIEYIARTNGHGRKPLIVQDSERRFRINEPADDWPDLVPFVAPAPDDGVEALIARLEKTSHGDDPAAFEIACCDAFSHLGFLTTHLGGEKEPDGVATAQFGPLAYRVMLECKTGKRIVEEPDAAEAAKFVGPFKADFAVMIGPEFSEEIELLDELKNHRVTAMTVLDLTTLLTLRANFQEVRAILQPGFASDLIGDLTWERRHGRAKRVAVVTELIHREGWASQVTAAEQSDRGEAPHLTIDAAMLLVDAALKAAGSTQACTREEVEAAFTYLTHARVQLATWLDVGGSAIAILRPYNASTRLSSSPPAPQFS
jgi:hypothetical protein